MRTTLTKYGFLHNQPLVPTLNVNVVTLENKKNLKIFWQKLLRSSDSKSYKVTQWHIFFFTLMQLKSFRKYQLFAILLFHHPCDTNIFNLEFYTIFCLLIDLSKKKLITYTIFHRDIWKHIKVNILQLFRYRSWIHFENNMKQYVECVLNAKP